MRWFSSEKTPSAAETALLYAATFFSAFAVVLAVEWFPRFRDPDSFYHVKMALLMSENGVVTAFPWLPFTSLGEHYADHHFLYHVLIIPFITVFGQYHGMLIATAVIAALALTLFLALLRAHGVKQAPAYVFVLGTAAAFIFRLSLAKASAMSLSLMFLALIAIRKRSPIGLFVIAWLYVLSYGGWPIVLIVAGASLVARLISDRLTDEHPWKSWARGWFWRRMFIPNGAAWKQFLAVPETQLMVAAIGGALCGLVVNPYFPTNLRFYWEQIVQIAIVGQRAAIGVGSEWYPYSLDRIIGESGGAFLLWMLTLAVLAFMIFWPDVVRPGRGRIHRDELVPLIASSLLALAFLVLTLRSKRHMEYLVPCLVFSAALAAQALRERLDPQAALRRLKELFPRIAVRLPLIASGFVAIFIFIGIRDVVLVRNLYAEGVKWNHFSGASAWVAAHAPEGAVVVHSDWDDFPALFFNDSERRYVIGLDPTFLYRHDPARYRDWTDLTAGRTAQPSMAARDRFGAAYVIVEKDHESMLNAFKSDPLAQLSYEDDEAAVFVIL